MKRSLDLTADRYGTGGRTLEVVDFNANLMSDGSLYLHFEGKTTKSYSLKPEAVQALTEYLTNGGNA